MPRNDLLQSIGNLKGKEPWLKAGEKLGFTITKPRGGSSHWQLRHSSFPVDDIRGVITIHDGMNKQSHARTFKKFLGFGIKEDDIWKALSKL